MNLRELSDLWLDQKRGTVKGNTFTDTYFNPTTRHILPTLEDVDICELTRKQLQALLTDMGKQYSNSLLKKVRLCAKQMYDYAIEEELCTVNPAINIKVKSQVIPRTRIPYSSAEADALFEYAAAHPKGLGVCIMLDLGLRCSEMLGLKWSDINIRSGLVSVQRASVLVNKKAVVSSPKSVESCRTIPIPKRLLALLRDKSKGQTSSDYIICRPDGQPHYAEEYTRQKYNKFFKDEIADLGIPRLSPHMLRHTCGTLLYAKTGDIYAVSKFLGHSSVDVTTKYYVHSSPEVLRLRLSM